MTILIERRNIIMKLILAIMSNDDSPAVSSALTKENYQVTRLATTGGFLRAGNTTLIVGTDDDKIERAIEVIGEYSSKTYRSCAKYCFL